MFVICIIVISMIVPCWQYYQFNKQREERLQRERYEYEHRTLNVTMFRNCIDYVVDLPLTADQVIRCTELVPSDSHYDKYLKGNHDDK